jgi:putative flippase GtrA
MSVARHVLRFAPAPLRPVLIRHRESLKFLVVGGTCFIVATGINYGLKLTVLTEKPVTALTVATIVSSIVSYVLNREWSFRTRGGRERRHEAALFFLVCGIAVGVNDIPLYFSRYVLDLQTPAVSLLTQEVADFVSGIVVGTFLAMIFRLWAFKKFVFPQAGVRDRRLDVRSRRRTGRAWVRHRVIAHEHSQEPVRQPAGDQD